MIIRANAAGDNYLAISHTLLHDSTISYASKGLACSLLAGSVSVGSTPQHLLDELESHGYLKPTASEQFTITDQPSR